MPDSVIPDAAAEALAPISPARQAQLERVELAHAAVHTLGESTIKCAQSEKGAKLMRYLDDQYATECRKLDGIIASEALGQAVEVNGSVISLPRNGEASH